MARATDAAEQRALADGTIAEGGTEQDDAPDVFISFNNNNRDYPVRNALAMKRMLGQPTPGGHADSLPRDLFA